MLRSPITHRSTHSHTLTLTQSHSLTQGHVHTQALGGLLRLPHLAGIELPVWEAEQLHPGQLSTGVGCLFCSFVLLGKQGKRRRFSALATMAMWWIFGKWYPEDATKCFQATSSEPQRCPSWAGHHPHPDPHSLSAHELCKGERRHYLQNVWVEMWAAVSAGWPSSNPCLLALL